MDIQAAEARRLQHRLWQDQAVRCHNTGIQSQRSKISLRCRLAPQPGRDTHGKVQGIRLQMNGATPERLSASGGPGRLAVYGGNVVPGLMKGHQSRDGEVRGAHERDPHVSYRFRSSCFARCSLARRRMIMFRFNDDR